MEITLKGVKPYDGTYELDFVGELTIREWGWIKKFSGYLPLTLDDETFGDPEFAAVLALIALHRAGRIEAREVPSVYERLADAPFGTAIKLNLGAADAEEEDDAGPPALSSNGSSDSSGTDSTTSSGTSPSTHEDSGTSGSDSSESVPATSGT